ncbi:MAG: multidrug efflux RND transporter permease subunit [Rhodospirillales bacterium]|nr:multidrug efflux RND transporter permease subunit [Rhodospirillales bacterium]
MLSAFFIDRPKFAFVLSIVITLAGLIALTTLPVDQYPDITPPVVQVTASYPGASALVVESTVAEPLEQQINGVEGMIYIASTSGNDGSLTVQVTFEVGTDPDIAQVNVQNRVALAQPQLPQEVVRQGLSVRKQSTNLLLVINLTSPNETHDSLYLSNFASINLVDALARVPGVGQVTIFGARDYSMRMWLDVARMASLGITTSDVVNAVREQNVQVAPGQIGGAPSDPDQQFQYTIRTLGRLVDIDAFRDIIVRARSDGSSVKIKDIARVELGARSYASFGLLNGKPSANIGIYQLPGSNALAVATSVQKEVDRLSARFPPDLKASILYDTTRFVDESIKEVAKTLAEALLLVVLVVFVFLQDWRMTVIPSIAIPVSLIGTFAAMQAVGFSINVITLLALVLSIGIVVDDAIIVVENVQRKLTLGLSPRDAAVQAMREVTSPIIATSLVLLAVFVPVGFIPGITGKLYQQFALTIAVAVLISTVNALTLSPALCAAVLRPHETAHGWFFRTFNRGFDAVLSRYTRAVRALVARVGIVVLVFVCLIGTTVLGFVRLPQAFLPVEDQGYFFVNLQLPAAASLQRTSAVMAEVGDILQKTPGIHSVVAVGGFSFLTGTTAANSGVLFAVLDPWFERDTTALKAENIVARTRGRLWGIPEATVIAFNPPSIRGLGSTGGFDFQLQDPRGDNPQELAAALRALLFRANQTPELRNVFSTFQADVPQIWIDVDREKAKKQGVPLDEIFSTLQTQLGSFYVNDFNMFGRTYRVLLQADTQFRGDPDDILQLYVRNERNEMVPLRTLVALSSILGPENVRRYNLVSAAQVNGEPAPGYSSGDAVAAMERLAAEVLPPGMTYEWSGVTFQEIRAGQKAPVLFALAIVFAYLFLVAQYESWSIPLSVMLCVPLAAAGAVAGLLIAHINNDIYAQIGMVLLIGLAAKNAILIVEFARTTHAKGGSLREAAVTAATLRFRAIMMTAFSFILGVIPLLFASGAGAASRQSLGTTVFAGLLAATSVGTLLVPAFYVGIQGAVERWTRRASRTSSDHTQGPSHG